MKKHGTDFSIPEDMDVGELDEIYKELEKFSVKYPDESCIDETLDTLRMYMPRKGHSLKGYGGRFRLLMHMAAMEISFMSGAYWAISIILFMLGCEFTITNSGDPYAAVLLLSPVPFVLGMAEVFKGREEGMLEIEMSCRISAGEIMLSRLLLIGIYNVLFDTIFMAVLGAFLPGINMMKVLLSWMVPLTLISGVSLTAAIRIRANYAAAIFISGWAAAVLAIVTRREISDFLMGLNALVYVAVIFIGIMIVIFEAGKIRSIYSREGRGAAVEIND